MFSFRLSLSFFVAFALSNVNAQALGPVTQALSSAEAEARGSILTGIAGILGVIVLIGVAGGVVRALTRTQ